MNFKKEIYDRGLKQKFLAERVGLSEPELSMFLNGTRIMPESISEKIKQEIKQIPKPKDNAK